MARSQDMTASRVDEVIELVGLGSAARRKAGGYSLGMRQRLGIAAAMLGDPPVIIMDEPFNGMDPEGIIWMRRLLRSLAAEGRAILVSSHLMSELQDMADHVVVIGRGKVLADASVEELIARASGDQVLVRTPAAPEAGGALQRAGSCSDGHRRGHPQRVGTRSAAHRGSPRPGAGSLLRGHRPAGDPRGRLPPTHQRRSRVPGRLGQEGAIMMAATSPPPRPPDKPQRQGFGPVLRSEWTKFRTVRGWVIGLVVAAVLCVAFTFVVANGNHEGGCTGPPPPGSGPNSPGTNCYTGHPFVPTGPNGEAVADSYQFVEQPLTGNGTLTAQVTSLTGLISTGPANIAPSLAHTEPGLAAWAKAGILVTPSTKQGSPYAAIMATGSHGIRFQYNYTHDQPGLPGAITSSAPRWLRLTRTGDTLTGYDSTNGTTWHEIGTAHLAGLPATVIVGLFVTSPVSFQDSSSGAPTQATATFDHITLNGHAVSDDWQSHSIGTGPQDYYPTLGTGSYPPLRQHLRRQRLR